MIGTFNPRHNLWFPILSILIVYMGSSMVLGLAFKYFEAFYYPDFFTFVAYVGSFMITIIYAVAIRHSYGIAIPSFRLEKWNINPLLIVAGLILMLATSIVLSPILKMLPSEYIDTLDDYMVGGFWPMLTAVIAAPILEEFLFRGIIQKNIVNRIGPIWGIVIGSVIFGAMHMIPQQIIYASCLSLILGSIYYLTGSLNSAIAVHFINNGLTFLLYMIFGTSQGIEQKILGDGSLWNWTYAISVILLLGGIWYVVHRIYQQRQEETKVVNSDEN